MPDRRSPHPGGSLAGKALDRGDRMIRTTGAVVTSLAVAIAGLAVSPPPAVAATNEGPTTFVREWGYPGSGTPSTPQFASPGGIGVGADGDVYVGDGSGRIQRFSPSGTVLGSWGGVGSGPGRFRNLTDVDIGGDGLLYAVDQNHGVEVYDSQGTYLRALADGTKVIDVAVDAAGHAFVLDTTFADKLVVYGPDGSQQGSWNVDNHVTRDPAAVAVNQAGEVLLLDRDNDQVDVYDQAGLLQRTVGAPGTAVGQFSLPGNLAVDADDRVHVTDTWTDRVQRFASDGTFQLAFGSTGTGNGQFREPADVAVGPDGHVWVYDSEQGRVQEHSADGTFIRCWGTPGDGGPQFSGASGVARDAAGNLYVADTGNDRVQKLDPTGAFLASWGQSGAGNGQFEAPDDVETGLGSLFVSDTGNDRIQRLSLTGDHQATWGTTGALTGQFSSPGGLDVSGGEVYVADRGNQRIQVFDPDGDFLREWPTAAAPEGVAVDQDGNVVVAEGSRLETFTATGTPLATHVLDTTARAVGVEIDGGGNTWVADGERDQLLKLRPDGTVVEHVALTAGMPFGTRRTPQDLAFSADRRIFVVTGERLMEYQGPTGALLDVSLTVATRVANVGDAIDYRFTLRNTGTVALTEVAISDPAAPECSGPVADLAPGTSRIVDCAHVAVPADVGQFTTTATVTSAQGVSVSSGAVTIPVGAGPRPAFTGTGPPVGSSPRGLAGRPEGGYLVGRSAPGGPVDRFDPAGVLEGSVDTGIAGNDLARGPDGDLYLTYGLPSAQFNTFAGYVRRAGADGTSEGDYTIGSSGQYLGVAVDESERVLVAEQQTEVCGYRDPGSGNCERWDPSGADRVRRFSADAASSTIIGGPGSGAGHLSAPLDVAAGAGRVVVADRGNDRVVAYGDDGTFLWAQPLADPRSVAMAPDGTIYASSDLGGVMASLSPDGVLRSAWVAPTFNEQVLAVDGAGQLYALDPVDRVVRRFTPVVDATEPTVTVTSPAGDAVVVQGASVTADYACADEVGGSGLASCVGPVADGAAIDTATLGTHPFSVTGTDHAGNDRVVDRPYQVTARPDALVAVSTTAAFRGEDRYESRVVSGQTAVGGVARRATRTFRVRVGNDGGAPASFTVRGVASGSPGYTVRYLRGGIDISPAVRAGTFAIADLAPGATVTIKVKVTAGPTAATHSARNVDVTVRSTAGPTARDVVRARATRT